MMKHAAVLIVCLAAGAQAQVIKDSIQTVGGGGRSAIIGGNKEEKPYYGPTWMTDKMVYTGPGRVVERIKDGDQVILRVESRQKEGARDILLAGYPDAANVAVDELAACIAVAGPIRDDLGDRRLFYFFSKDDINDQIKTAFEQNHPGVSYR